MKPLSRGTLRLHSADANEQPDIRLNLASDPEDARRLREAVRLLAAFVQTPNSRLSARKTLSSTTATLFGRQNSPASPSETSGRMLLSNALWPLCSSRGHRAHGTGT
jgi:hypothetical protein